MIARIVVASLLVVAASVATTHDGAAAAPRAAVVTGTRIHLGDLVSDVDEAAAAVDLGPSPAAGVSRLVTRADIVAALEAKQVPCPTSLPDAFRVLRKAKHLAAADLNAIVASAVAAKELGHGVTLASVRADRPIDLADGWTRVGIDMPRAPKKAGKFSTIVIASFFAGDEVTARLPVPVDLAVSAEGATFDAPRGTSVTLIVRRNLVEIRTSGVAGADADVGDAVPIQLRPSGHVVRARLISKDEALALEAGR